MQRVINGDIEILPDGSIGKYALFDAPRETSSDRKATPGDTAIAAAYKDARRKRDEINK